MAVENNHGYFQEFKRTPQEKRLVEDRRRIEALEKQVSILEKKIDDLILLVGKEGMDGNHKQSGKK